MAGLGGQRLHPEPENTAPVTPKSPRCPPRDPKYPPGDPKEPHCPPRDPKLPPIGRN